MEQGPAWKGYLYLGGVILGTTLLVAWTNYQTYGHHYTGIWDGHFGQSFYILYFYDLSCSAIAEHSILGK